MYGYVYALAKAVAEGARSVEGAEVGIRRVPETLPDGVLKKLGVESGTIDQELVVKALADFSEVFAEIKPYQQKELMRLVLHTAILRPDSLKLGLYGQPPELRPLAEGDARFQTFKWLPSVSPDMKYLFFTKFTQGGHEDFYWVDAKVIENLRRKGLK